MVSKGLPAWADSPAKESRAVQLNLQLDHLIQPLRQGGGAALFGGGDPLDKALEAAREAPGRFGFSEHRHAVLVNRGTISADHFIAQRLACDQFVGRMMTLAVAVERFRLAEGRIPDTAADVVPRFLPAVPLDVDGKPLRFQKQGDGFLIYSVGDDGVDSWHGTPPESSHWPQVGDGDWLLDFSPR